MIRVTDLRKSYGPLVAVDGVSFAVERGGSFALLGPNGAGKTTTISMITGLLKPDSGSVALGDEGANPVAPAARMLLGTVPQSLSIYEDLTADENLRFFGGIYGLRGRQLAAAVDRAFEVVSLAERRADRVSTYSGGMKRRLNIAASLLHDPPVMLLDEPTVGVDPQSRNHIFETIGRLRGEGRTILYTTHYMEEAERLCERVAIMDHGRLLAEDSVNRLIAAHGGDERVIVELAEARAPADHPFAELAADGATFDGTRLCVPTRDPFELIQRIGACGLSIRTLRVERPSLEDVFLNLTGRTLRDL
jgi:ABC-2 type transport system ATP-binding protein